MKSIVKTLIFLAFAALLVAIGRWSVESSAETQPSADSTPAVQEAEVWTCPMHAQIQLPDFGPCPICGMDLVLRGATSGDPRHLTLSASAATLARIVTTPVERRPVTRSVSLVGKVDLDETAVRTISAWVPGRLERLFVDYTGVQVAEGDHLVSLYSPDLLTAQDELLAARELLEATSRESSEFLAKSNLRSYEAAREKLLLWGLTESQVLAIEERGTAEDHVMLTSPSGGVVIEKLLDQGAYVQTGTPIYRIADLDHLWVRLDAYEQDLAWLRHGQEVDLVVEALPGERVRGTIAFIDPIIHEHTRTAKVRVNVANERRRLKPGMFVRGVAQSRLGDGGVVLDRYLAGKWVSPMHPEIVKDGPGECDVCGMDLVRAEELGLVSGAPESAVEPLVVPASAVLVTGKRAVVYVEVLAEGGAEGALPVERTYEGREVVLGPRAGDDYLVFAGLEEGERVVTNGAFRIDSSMQILAKPSMMSQPAEASALGTFEAEALRAALEPLFETYLRLQVALAADDEAAARVALEALVGELDSSTFAGLPGLASTLWKEQRAVFDGAHRAAHDAKGIASLRVAFEALTTGVIALAERAGNPLDSDLRVVHCPMAFDDVGADWVQVGEVVSNPYFGSEMLRCGAVVRTLGGE